MIARRAPVALFPYDCRRCTCAGLACREVRSGGGSTNLTGQVFDPSGQVPLYNAVVYVPNGEVKPIPEGLTCDRCGSPTSGDPLVSGLTDATGTYTLRNVPAGTTSTEGNCSATAAARSVFRLYDAPAWER